MGSIYIRSEEYIELAAVVKRDERAEMKECRNSGEHQFFPFPPSLPPPPRLLYSPTVKVSGGPFKDIDDVGWEVGKGGIGGEEEEKEEEQVEKKLFLGLQHIDGGSQLPLVVLGTNVLLKGGHGVGGPVAVVVVVVVVVVECAGRGRNRGEKECRETEREEEKERDRKRAIEKKGRERQEERRGSNIETKALGFIKV